ncbi:hypothetical protein [Streptomyces sp. NPDC057460]
MRTTVDHFTAAEEVALDQARGLARTIADTSLRCTRAPPTW